MARTLNSHNRLSLLSAVALACVLGACSYGMDEYELVDQSSSAGGMGEGGDAATGGEPSSGGGSETGGSGGTETGGAGTGGAGTGGTGTGGTVSGCRSADDTPLAQDPYFEWNLYDNYNEEVILGTEPPETVLTCAAPPHNPGDASLTAWAVSGIDCVDAAAFDGIVFSFTGNASNLRVEVVMADREPGEVHNYYEVTGTSASGLEVNWSDFSGGDRQLDPSRIVAVSWTSSDSDECAVTIEGASFFNGA